MRHLRPLNYVVLEVFFGQTCWTSLVFAHILLATSRNENQKSPLAEHLALQAPMLQLTEVVSALSTMARRLSLSIPASNVCMSRRQSSLATLPSVGITPGSLERPFLVSSHPVSQTQCESQSGINDKLFPDSQCYLASNQWSFMNERFFSERISLKLLGSA